MSDWKKMYEKSTVYVNKLVDVDGYPYYTATINGGTPYTTIEGEEYNCFNGTPAECLDWVKKQDPESGQIFQQYLSSIERIYAQAWK